jgi:ABC-type dipeptide/oligopeptide/nickel transport system ATPase component
MPKNKGEVLLAVKGLRTYFYTPRGVVKAVDGIDFEVRRGEVYGLVGESGSGKSVTALSVMGLVQPPGKILEGEIVFKGRNLRKLPEEEFRSLKGREAAMIFQEPYTSLNPVFTVGWQVAEAISAHRAAARDEAAEIALALLKRVALDEPERIAASYPHQLSGGERQRAMLAMALANGPELLISDEPTTALDVTVQKEILELLMRIKDSTGMAILFITHNFGIIARIADRVGVMCRGRIVEESDKRSIMTSPRHPYTRGLLDSVLRIYHGRR